MIMDKLWECEKEREDNSKKRDFTGYILGQDIALFSVCLYAHELRFFSTSWDFMLQFHVLIAVQKYKSTGR